MVFFGLWIVIKDGKAIQLKTSQKKWPIAQGTIVESQVIGGKIYEPQVAYKYKVKNYEHFGKTDLKVPYFGPSSSRKEVAYKSIAKFPAESTHPVYFNPKDPKESYLKPGPTWDEYTRLALGTMFYGIGSFFLILNWITKCKPAQVLEEIGKEKVS